jgi:hypothetical protein
MEFYRFITFALLFFDDNNVPQTCILESQNLVVGCKFFGGEKQFSAFFVDMTLFFF